MTDTDYKAATTVIPSATDVDHLALLRGNIRRFLQHAGETKLTAPQGRLLDIAPQDHEGAAPFFPQGIVIDTLDIDPASDATYIADICANNEVLIASSTYDYVVCTEVLEHTLQPFDAVKEIRRLLKPGGRLFLSTPFNFRIHGPLPDCWRFTEHGLRALLTHFNLLELNALETPDRPLMPVQYTLVAEKPLTG